MDTDPIDELGPPLAIGAIMIAVGLALPLIALWWMALHVWRRVKKEPRERG